ncbi:TonB-dependent receptor plug domain-containing protein [Pedobacter aquae]|uniref:TonB-dependent receptor plug domain-containing protein n=1 Tax=Pedobacter aquae TaxID=2605747 RepID=A0A5C0VJC2_9SPHI|nr:carboxypeptidase-like regulatory domain-containing protein [Pedobacter aquae]QEK51873.1 TonB-dependent receptor plug domain-containing protein [Pedobacter aquae]
MKRRILLSIVMLCCSFFAFPVLAQNVKGKVIASDNSTLPGVSVTVQGSFVGTSTNGDGAFALNVNFEKGPIVLEFSMLGFQTQKISLSKPNADLKVTLKEASINFDELVVSASRVEERILEAPVTVTKVSSNQLLAGGGPEMFSNLARYQGIDVNSSSMLLTTISTRGFNSPKSERMIQLADYVDTQVPSLNLNAGNMLGVAELDVSSVEIIHGPASALYGANAFNGVLLTNSKDPFYTEGLSLKLRGGNRSLFDGQIRYAKKLTDKLAFKINASYFSADDWMANDQSAKRITSAKNYGPGSAFGYDALNTYGEISTVQAGVTTPIVPGEVIYTPGWSETALIANDNRTLSYRINPSISYLITDKIKATLDYKRAGGTTTYQSTSRYRFKNLSVDQFRAELKSDKWFLRAFRTEDNGGDTYDLSFLGARMATLNPTAAGLPALPINPTTGQPYTSHTQQFFTTYGGAIQQGATPAQAYAAASATWPQAGSPSFNALRKYNAELNQPAGSRLPVNSVMTDVSGQYQFGFKFADVIVGGAYRAFGLASQGAVFEDSPGGDRIENYEYGVYSQVAKTFFNDALKLQVAARLDDFKNFESKFSPRASAVYTFGEKRQHNFRSSYGVAFRSPTQIDQYIRLDIGSALLLGNVRNGFNGYNTTLLTQGSPAANIAAVAGGSTAFNYAAPRLDLEQVATFEVGYKTIIQDKLTFDITYFRSNYNNFIGAQPFIGNTDGSRPTAGQIAVAVGAVPAPDPNDNNVVRARNRLNDASSPTRIIQVWFNSQQEVTTQGVSVGLGYAYKKELNFNANYSYNKIGDLPTGFLAFFNTPENKFNLGIDGEFKKRLGYNVNYRWQQGFVYEFPFDVGPIDNIGTLDASLSYKVPKAKSTIQIGGSNLTNAYNTQIWGGPQLGRMIFAGILVDIK